MKRDDRNQLMAPHVFPYKFIIKKGVHSTCRTTKGDVYNYVRTEVNRQGHVIFTYRSTIYRVYLILKRSDLRNLLKEKYIITLSAEKE